MEITAIMSVYNGAQYLQDSIGSLLKQSSPNWRLICIDDGSTDSSLQILQEYSKQDHRITVLHQDNKGLSIARAVAFSHATTEYVSILDCDDAYDKTYIEKMIAKALYTRADAIISDVTYGYADTPKSPNHFVQYNLDENFHIKDGAEALGLTVPWRIHGWFCIKREIIQKYYTEEAASASVCKHYFDEYLARLMYFHCKSFTFCNACYLYRVAEGSITRSISLKKIDILTSLDFLLDLCVKEQLSHKIIINVYNEYYCQILNLWNFSYSLPKMDVKEGQHRIKNMYQQFRAKISVNIIMHAPFRTQIKLFLSLSGFWFIKLIAKT